MNFKTIELCIENGSLLFGDFVLKSGKTSPYFFNAAFDQGQLLYHVAERYADHLFLKYNSDLVNYTLFGAAYKGIPLISAIGCVLFQKYKLNCNIVFNRKEVKDHGEGGNLVGKIAHTKLIIIDDVLTRGTALLQVFDMIKVNAPGASIERAVVLLDRMEKVENTTARLHLKKSTLIEIDAIISLMDLVNYLEKEDKDTHVKMLSYL